MKGKDERRDARNKQHNSERAHTHGAESAEPIYPPALSHTVKGDESTLANRLYPGYAGEGREKQM